MDTLRSLELADITAAVAELVAQIRAAAQEALMVIGPSEGENKLSGASVIELRRLGALLERIRKDAAVASASIHVLTRARGSVQARAATEERAQAAAAAQAAQEPIGSSEPKADRNHDLVNGGVSLKEVVIHVVIDRKSGDIIYIGDPSQFEQYNEALHGIQKLGGGTFARRLLDEDIELDPQKAPEDAVADLISAQGIHVTTDQPITVAITEAQVRSALAWRHGKLLEKRNAE